MYGIKLASKRAKCSDKTLPSGKEKKRKVLRFNVQFKNQLNQLSISHKSNKKSYEERNKTVEVRETTVGLICVKVGF